MFHMYASVKEMITFFCKTITKRTPPGQRQSVQNEGKIMRMNSRILSKDNELRCSNFLFNGIPDSSPSFCFYHITFIYLFICLSIVFSRIFCTCVHACWRLVWLCHMWQRVSSEGCFWYFNKNTRRIWSSKSRLEARWNGKYIYWMYSIVFCVHFIRHKLKLLTSLDSYVRDIFSSSDVCIVFFLQYIFLNLDLSLS